MKTVFKNANNGAFDIVTEDGKIVALEKTSLSGFDLDGADVYPGLFDMHSHGCMGYDTMDQKYLHEMSVFQAEHGTTSWLPTTMTVSMDEIRAVVNAPLPDFQNAAAVLGYHMEGPYISPRYKGAQNECYIKAPDLEEFSALSHIRVVTIAPELPGSMDFIRGCKSVVSLGHTAADYETAAAAMDAGAVCLTHTFNAMPPLHHRSPGPIGAAITKNAYVQVISDGLHLHPSVVLGLYKIFGADRMLLISDSMRATGMPDGNYEFGGQEITVKDRVARTQDGALAGSTTPLFDCVKRAISFGIPKQDAFRMASLTPAQLCGIKNKGLLAPGYDADFITVDDELNLSHVIIGGNKIK